MLSSRVRLAFSVLLLALVAVSGCVNVQVVDRSGTTTNAAPTSIQMDPAQHDLAVLAVDFDPPLDYQEVLARKGRGEGITLLVAIENTGLTTERDVWVQASLSERLSETVYVEKQGLVDVIAPGEIKIVQLRDTDIPFSFAYTLSVSVVPTAGETRLGDNYKTYDLLITQP